MKGHDESVVGADSMPAFHSGPLTFPGRRFQRGITGAVSDACFLACLAAFFSFGVNAGCFFASLLLCLILPMIPILGYAPTAWLLWDR
jgi:hypothetical protein